MGQKHVLITFSRAPYGSIFYTEGLRAAVGVTSGIDEHTVDVLYMGDGVNFALKGVDRNDSAKYLATLSAQHVKLKAEEEALAERNIAVSDLADDVEAIGRSEILDLVRNADVTIDF